MVADFACTFINRFKDQPLFFCAAFRGPHVPLDALQNAASLLAGQVALLQQTGSWGDQGNDTYKTPIFAFNHPDNDVIRVGDTFYMMSSTCPK